MPLLYSLATASTLRSTLIKLVEEKSKRYKELQKVSNAKLLRSWEWGRVHIWLDGL